jgi:4'-phosphopantetheinyl transferase
MLSIDVYYSSLDANPDQLQQNWNVLDSNEKIQADKFKNPVLRDRYVRAHGQLRTVLAHYVNAAPASLRIAKTSHGKPYLVDYTELAFNLSHTSNVMVLAIAKQCQLGVDIEQCKPRGNLADLVAKCFSDAEASYWQQLNADQQHRQFYQFWTRKEALVKATGLGISLGLKHCVINPANPQQFLTVPAQCGLATQWHNRDLTLDDDTLCAALVANQPIERVNQKSL